MTTPDTRSTVIYATVGLILLGALVTIGRSVLPGGVASCVDRYPNATLFRLEREGALVTLDEIQSRAGEHTSVGLRENVEIMKPRDPRVPAAMQVSLRNAGAPAQKGGVSFPWWPRSAKSGTALCLSDNVFFYGDLEFHSGGTLPGIEGSDRTHASKDGFAANLAWLEDGQVGVRLAVVADGEPEAASVIEAKGVNFSRAQWIKIDQEVILNSPGQSDGVLRVWIDGSLAIERKDISYRTKDEVVPAGVAAKVFYGAPGAVAAAPADTTIWVSPLELGSQ